MKKFFDSELWKWISMVFEVLLAAVVLLLFFNLIRNAALGEDVWVLCEPESFVCIRENPKKTSFAFGGATFGTRLETDGETKNGFLHVINLAAESETGWISTLYIVYDEPKIVSEKAIVVSNGRLAARKGVYGKIRRWMKPMTEVSVIVRTDEWCITNYGYVMTEYLETVGE